ncbi:MAG: endolytic transglycosylase MltG [Spirochaetaceae bacterium]|jgi:UPF0755 protein|nr:endolytic transglycosylase MltG [Spirochaetaceae bacterium]
MPNKKIYMYAARITGTILALAVIGAAAIVGTAIYLNAPPPLSETTRTRIEIREGESAAAAGRQLAAAGLIKSAHFWTLITRIQKEHIKTGVYTIPAPISALAIYAILKTGKQENQPVTIPEGSTIKKTAAIWAAADICDADAFIKAAESAEIAAQYNIPAATMEGYLYPDTYNVPPRYDAEKLVHLMVRTFFKRLAEIEPAATLSPGELHRAVTLASIVEREYRVASEAPLIAGVFQNRMERGMRLESCATVEYIITEIQNKPHPKRLYTRDTQIENPYNTYTNRGLPPGPIASPGAVALRAALNPQPSEYLFFRLVDSSAGKHYFSRTLDDHIKAAALLVKG